MAEYIAKRDDHFNSLIISTKVKVTGSGKFTKELPVVNESRSRKKYLLLANFQV
jgi:hypothetical protein